MSKTCKFCNKAVFGRGMCSRHYKMLQRANLLDASEDLQLKEITARDSNKNIVCYICGEKGKKTTGLCDRHTRYVRYHGLVGKSPEDVKAYIEQNSGVCKVCEERDVFTKGYCSSCHIHLKNADKLDSSLEEQKDYIKNLKCGVCGGKLHARGLCVNHYMKAEKEGLLVLPNDEVVHQLILREDLNSEDESVVKAKAFERLYEASEKPSCALCFNPAYARGICRKHYARASKLDLLSATDSELIEGLKVVEPLYASEGRKCVICGRDHYARSLCKKHYAKARHHKLLELNDADIESRLRELECQRV